MRTNFVRVAGVGWDSIFSFVTQYSFNCWWQFCSIFVEVLYSFVDAVHVYGVTGQTIITLIETAIYYHLEATIRASRIDDIRYHLLKFIQLLVDIFFWDMKAQSFDLSEVHLHNRKLTNTVNPVRSEDEDRRFIFSSAAQTTFANRITEKTVAQIHKIPPAHW